MSPLLQRRKGTTHTTDTSEDETTEKQMKFSSSKCKVIPKGNKNHHLPTNRMLETKQVEDLSVAASLQTAGRH